MDSRGTSGRSDTPVKVTLGVQCLLLWLRVSFRCGMFTKFGWSPGDYTLEVPTPNPFRGSTTRTYALTRLRDGWSIFEIKKHFLFCHKGNFLKVSRRLLVFKPVNRSRILYSKLSRSIGVVGSVYIFFNSLLTRLQPLGTYRSQVFGVGSIDLGSFKVTKKKSDRTPWNPYVTEDTNLRTYTTLR